MADMENHSLNSSANFHVSSARFGSPTESGKSNSALDWSPGSEKDNKKPRKILNAFLKAQRDNLLDLRAELAWSIDGVSRQNRFDELARTAVIPPNSEDAGGDAYDRDFAVSVLSGRADALLEIDDALARIEAGTYGICEMSGAQIPQSRLKAIPFARFTVECQAEVEKQRKLRSRSRSFRSPFSIADDADGNEARNFGEPISYRRVMWEKQNRMS
jgi:RNA polymerase-binding transcription factor DksA